MLLFLDGGLMLLMLVLLRLVVVCWRVGFKNWFEGGSEFIVVVVLLCILRLVFFWGKGGLFFCFFIFGLFW